MTADNDQARETIRRCLEFREAGRREAVLRSEIQSRLRLIFPSPEDETWINHYSAGAEAHTTIGTAGGGAAGRFIDNLVGSTTIEYEPDLRIQARREEGLRQVREHAAGLMRSRIPSSQIRGILSDTLDWYAFDVSLPVGVDPQSCAPDEVSLLSVDEIHITEADEPSAERLIAFLRKHLAREQSRPLVAELLTSDLGLDSGACQRTASFLLDLVNNGRAADPSIALATDLWSDFVDFLERESGAFRPEAYVDEVYVCILARLLSANVLADHALSSNDDELEAIINGSHFRTHYQLDNMVEMDYFGWLTNPPYIGALVPIARQLQRDLYAYDFSYRPEEDLFGRLMAELARRSHRKLLGQEWTPGWLARLLAERCLAGLPLGERPRIVDMCCGSGSILAEVLKTARSTFGFTDIETLHDVSTGFDIDPLAVSLSKTTWVVTLAQEIKRATGPIIIPVYHADSLFAVTPVSRLLPPPGEDQLIPVSLDGTRIMLPNALVQPSYRDLFDRIIDWAYDEARHARVLHTTDYLSQDSTRAFLEGAASAAGIALDPEFEDSLVAPVHELARRMAELAVAGRNGIWAFILRNTYRPGLLAGQFNGLVSNPPWLAMSGLADNPYRTVLGERANRYGIRPQAQSFLHLELGTTHLIHAIDRYLVPGASVACLVPGTVCNGHHHEPLRQRAFLSSERPVPFEINEVWQVAPGTFKYPGAALIGHKRLETEGLERIPIAGFLARHTGLEPAEFSIRNLGTGRTAWVLEREGLPVAAGGMAEMPQQGADLMPRTAVCIEILSDIGPECRVDTPRRGTRWGFTVKAAKELKDAQFPGYVAPRFIHYMAQSENLLPFLLGHHIPPIAIPAERATNGQWQLLNETAIRGMGFTHTSRRFTAINESLQHVGQGKSLQQRVDERGKLTKQMFGGDGFLLLAGAGGKYICAACIPLADAHNLIVDQTLYWKIIPNPDEAWFFVGMLNSHAMTDAITPFNPRGAFGERHIHALPYRILPAFDALNETYTHIARLSRELTTMAGAIVTHDEYLNDPNRALTRRRSLLRARLFSTDVGRELELHCAGALGTTPAEDSGAE